MGEALSYHYQTLGKQEQQICLGPEETFHGDNFCGKMFLLIFQPSYYSVRAFKKYLLSIQCFLKEWLTAVDGEMYSVETLRKSNQWKKVFSLNVLYNNLEK